MLGCLVMALAGVFFAHLQLFVNPGNLDPTNTFYVWVAVILGGAGSNRGALFGGFVVVAIREGPRFIDQLPPAFLTEFPPEFLRNLKFITGDILFELPSIAISPGPLQLLLVGLLIILIMRFRPEGMLPPQRELIWPDAVDEDVRKRPDSGVREQRGGDGDE